MARATLAALVDDEIPQGLLPDGFGATSVRNLDTIAGRGLVPVAHCYGAQAAILDASTQTSVTGEMSFRVAGACRSITILESARGTGVAPLASAFRLKFSAKVVVGSTTYYVPIYWETGERLKTIYPGAAAVTKPLELDFAKDTLSGKTLTLRYYIEIDAGGSWPRRMSSLYGTYEYGVDKVDGGVALPSNPGGYAYSPTAILGHPTKEAEPIPSLGLYGDSIMQPANTNGGWVDVGFGSIPSINVAVNTERASGNYLDHPTNQAGRRPLAEHGLNALYEYGINSAYFGSAPAPLAELQDDLIRFCRAQLARHTPVWATTLTPYTTSTDSWATVANQTIYQPTYNAVRVAYNTWLRDGAPVVASTWAPAASGASGPTIIRAGEAGHPLAYEGCASSPGCVHPGIFDVALYCESSLNSGKWIAGGAGDGLHPNATGTAAMALACSAAVLKADHWYPLEG